MVKKIIFPDITWYETVSKRKEIQGHCPYADLYKCSRFWITREKLESTKLDSYEIEELVKFWSNEHFQLKRLM